MEKDLYTSSLDVIVMNVSKQTKITHQYQQFPRLSRFFQVILNKDYNIYIFLSYIAYLYLKQHIDLTYLMKVKDCASCLTATTAIRADTAVAIPVRASKLANRATLTPVVFCWEAT